MKKTSNKNSETKSSKRFLITFICIFLLIVIALSATLGIISATKNANAVAEYKGQTMDKEVASFFLSYYKYTFVQSLSEGVKDVEDAPAFWNKDSGNGKSYGQLLSAGAEEYIKKTLVANYLYDSYTKLSSAEKKKISKIRDGIVENKANGDKNLFNTLVAEHGFSYSSLYDALVMEYKAAMAQYIIYGENGSNIANFPELAEEYLQQYSHVKLIFIRTETKFVYENGDRVIGDDGEDLQEPLTPEEKEDRERVIAEIRAAITAKNDGNGVAINEEMFENYQKSFDEGEESSRADGHYFHKHSSYTAEFSEALKSVVDKAYEMEIGTFSEVELDFGVCFIYKMQSTVGAYASTLAEDCFGDFYSNAADFLFNESLGELYDEVELRENFYDIDVILLPYNYDYLP